MASENLKVDQNNKPVVGFVTDDSNQFIKMGRIDDTTKGLKVMLVGGTGSGDVVGPASAVNGHLAVFDGATGKLIKDGGAPGGLTIGTTTIASGTTTRILYDNAGVLGEYTLTGSGTVVVMATSPTLVTPVLGVATATSLNGNIFTTGTYTLTGQAGKTLTFNGSITLTGTDAQTYTFPTTSATIARTDAANTFIGASTATSWVFTTPILGTPTSGTLTNCTGLPIAGLVASTSTAIGVGSIELGAASDTTIARVSAGVISVEGVTVDTISATNTLTNKRITPRVLSASAYTTDTGSSINGDTQDMFIVTAQTGALKFNNPSGTPTDGQKLIISVASSTTSARALTWDTAYGSTTVTLPTTTAATTVTLTIGFIWSTSKSLWQCVATA